MNTYFSEYHNNIRSYCRTNATTFYNFIFSWACNDEKSWDQAQINKWCLGKLFIPERILNQAVQSPDVALGQYEIAFTSPAAPFNLESDSEDMLESQMDTFISMMPINLEIFRANARSIAKALVGVLVLDGLNASDRYVQRDLRSAINKKIAGCKANNTVFRTTHVIDILFQSPNTLLKSVFDEISALDENIVGLADTIAKDIRDYMSKSTHSVFQNVTLNDLDIVRTAKILNYEDKMQTINRVNSYVSQYDLCRALIRCKDSSNFVDKKICLRIGKFANIDQWDAVVKNCWLKLTTTTV
ncbi:MAG: hypothetical protein NC489_32365 [Ruminococcus flavefaciens]|nr:hypothetical protein [Ruminococcus flavefaciens]